MNTLELILVRKVLNDWDKPKPIDIDPFKISRMQNKVRAANGLDVVAVCEHCQGKMRFLPEDTGEMALCVYCGEATQLFHWEVFQPKAEEPTAQVATGDDVFTRMEEEKNKGDKILRWLGWCAVIMVGFAIAHPTAEVLFGEALIVALAVGWFLVKYFM